MPDIVIEGWIITHVIAAALGAAAMPIALVGMSRSVNRRKGGL